MRKLTYFLAALLSLCLFVGLSPLHAEVITLSNGVENASSFVFTAASLDDIKDIDTSGARVDIGKIYVDDNSEDGWMVTLASANDGQLRHTNYSAGKAGTFLDYALYIDSTDVNGILGTTLESGALSETDMINDLVLDAKTGATVTGATAGFDIAVHLALLTGDNTGQEAFTGTFTDTITVTHTD